MSSWTSRMARACALHPWRTLSCWAATLIAGMAAVALLLGSALTTEARLTSDPDSVVGFELLEERLPGSDPLGGEVVVVRSSYAVADPEFERFVSDLAADIEATGEVEPVPTTYVTGDPSLVSASGDATLLPVSLTATERPEEAVEPVVEVVRAADADPDFSVDITGMATSGRDFLEASEQDLRRGELYFGLPGALVVLLLVFGSAVGGLVPLALAAVCIPVSVGIAAVLGQAYELSFFIVNMVVAMGLALGIDYSLFVVSRYREERRGGLQRLAAIERAGATATVAVAFSGMSFTVALLGLLLVPDTILRSLAAGAIIVGVVTVAAAVTLLPAVLALLGDRVDSLRVPLVHSAVHSGSTTHGRYWRRFVGLVVRRPALWLAGSAGILLLAAVPVLQLNTGNQGVGSLPDSLLSKQGFLALQESFPASVQSDPAVVVVDGDVADPAVTAALDGLVARVEADARYGPTSLRSHPDVGIAALDVPLPGDPNAEPALAALRALRSDLVEPAFRGTPARAYVTGTSAIGVDYTDLIDRWLPIVMGFVLALTFVLLTLVFRSVVLSLKAVLLNLLSVGAAYGLLVLVFQEGVGAGLLGLTQSESVEPWVPVFLFSVLFALSMDYHVFLLSRIRERHAATGDTVEAVTHGIASTGRIITGAALIIVVVFAGFATGELVGFQQMGFGVAVALLIDATVVRSIVVPSSMVLLGRWNWYLPPFLRWLPELQVEGEPSAPARARGRHRRSRTRVALPRQRRQDQPERTGRSGTP